MHRITPAFNTSHITPAFKWRDRTGNFHKVSEMETRHLYYTLRMIWNHTMPEEVKLKPYNAYDFSPFYTAEYMTEAIHHIGTELFKRTDILPGWQKDLSFMASVVLKQNPLLKSYT